MARTIAKLYSPSISCNHCIQAIVGGLQGTPGIEKVMVDLDTKMVTVVYDTDYLSETDIRHRMRDIGYEAIG
ncbi:MAG: cation transporter [Actinomycetota bacterium]